MKIKVVYLGVVGHKASKKEKEYELAEGSSARGFYLAEWLRFMESSRE